MSRWNKFFCTLTYDKTQEKTVQGQFYCGYSDWSCAKDKHTHAHTDSIKPAAISYKILFKPWKVKRIEWKECAASDVCLFVSAAAYDYANNVTFKAYATLLCYTKGPIPIKLDLKVPFGLIKWYLKWISNDHWAIQHGKVMPSKTVPEMLSKEK